MKPSRLEKILKELEEKLEIELGEYKKIYETKN